MDTEYNQQSIDVLVRTAFNTQVPRHLRVYAIHSIRKFFLKMLRNMK